MVKAMNQDGGIFWPSLSVWLWCVLVSWFQNRRIQVLWTDKKRDNSYRIFFCLYILYIVVVLHSAMIFRFYHWEWGIFLVKKNHWKKLNKFEFKIQKLNFIFFHTVVFFKMKKMYTCIFNYRRIGFDCTYYFQFLLDGVCSHQLFLFWRFTRGLPGIQTQF